MLRHLLILLVVCSPSLASRNLTIHGNATLGYYYLEAYVGTPPQKKSLIIDTGSHLTIFPCSGCTKCRNHMYKVFNTKDSSTFQPINPTKNYFGWTCAHPEEMHLCHFKQGYTEGSEYSGYYGIDNFLFESELNGDSYKNHKHVFGCAMKETGEFYTQEADGIIGIGVAQTTKTDVPPTILDIELIEKRIDNHTFSICIAKNGGSMTLGGWNRALHLPHSKVRTLNSEDLKWSEQYHVHLSDIQIAGKPLDYDFESLNQNGGKVFLDTGTTFVYFGPQLFSKFNFFITNFCSDKQENCGGHSRYQECYSFNKYLYKNVDDFFNTFPKMTFKFNNDVEWAWHPQDYMVAAIGSSNHYCIGVKALKDIILGAIFMRNYDIHFDKIKKRVSFVRSNCGKTDEFIPSSDDDTIAAAIKTVSKTKVKGKSTIKSSKKAAEVKTRTDIIIQAKEAQTKQIEELEKEDSNFVLKDDFQGIDVPAKLDSPTIKRKTHTKPKKSNAKPNKHLPKIYLMISLLALSFVLFLVIRCLM
jgi:hypothetical protein